MGTVSVSRCISVRTLWVRTLVDSDQWLKNLCLSLPSLALRITGIGRARSSGMSLLKVDPPLECIKCQSPLTLKHILLNCVDFFALRQQFYSAGNMHDLFSKVKTIRNFSLFKDSWSLPSHIVQIH